MNLRILLSVIFLILAIIVNPLFIKNFYIADGDLDLSSLVITYFLSFFFFITSSFILVIKKKIKLLRYEIDFKQSFFYFLSISIIPLFFVSIESLLWFGNRFFGEPSKTEDIIAQNEMEKHSGNYFKSNGIIRPTKYSSKYFNINEEGFRTYEFKQKKKTTRIAIIGGSTTYGINVADQNTIPNILEKVIKNSRKKVSVWNLGVSGINSHDEFKILKSTHKKINPDIVIFYHGANDFANVYSEVKKKKTKSLILEDKLINRIYVTLNQFQTTSIIKMIIYYFKEILSVEEKINEDLLLSKEFTKQGEKISEYCNLNSLQCYFFIQPLLETKKYLTLFETKILYERKFIFPNYGNFYNIFVDNVIESSQIEYIDLRYTLNDNKKRFFYDYVHTTTSGNEIIANKIYEALVKNKAF